MKWQWVKSDTVGEGKNYLIKVFQFDQSKVTIPEGLLIWGVGKNAIQSGLNMTVGEDCESYKCQKRAGTEKMQVNQGLKWQWVILLNVKIVDNQGREEMQDV